MDKKHVMFNSDKNRAEEIFEGVMFVDPGLGGRDTPTLTGSIQQ